MLKFNSPKQHLPIKEALHRSLLNVFRDLTKHFNNALELYKTLIYTKDE
jgi:hypothetical protein